MLSKQDIILNLVKSGWLPGLSVERFPQFEKTTEQNLNAALEAVDRLGIGCVSIACHRPDVIELVKLTRKNFPHLVIGVHSLMDLPHATARASKLGLRIPPTPDEAYGAGAKILTSQSGFKIETYAHFENADAVLIAGGTTPSEWVEEWEKGANLAKFPGANLFPNDYLNTWQDSTLHLIPFYVSGHFVAPQMRMNPDKLKTVFTPYVMGGALLFGLGWPFRNREPKDPIEIGSASIKEIIEKGKILLSAVKEARKEVILPSGESLHQTIESARTYEELARNIGRSFNI